MTNGLFDTLNGADEFLKYYMSFDWTEEGDYSIIEIWIPDGNSWEITIFNTNTSDTAHIYYCVISTGRWGKHCSCFSTVDRSITCHNHPNSHMASPSPVWKRSTNSLFSPKRQPVPMMRTKHHNPWNNVSRDYVTGALAEFCLDTTSACIYNPTRCFPR